MISIMINHNQTPIIHSSILINKRIASARLLGRPQRIQEALKEQIPYRAPDILIAIHIQKRVDRRVEISEPPNERVNIVRYQIRIELRNGINNAKRRPANGKGRHEDAQHPRSLPIAFQPQILVVQVFKRVQRVINTRL